MVCLFAVFTSPVRAQTPTPQPFTVPVGGIALIGFDFDNDYFAFVCLVPIPAGTKVLFTDNGWISDTVGFRTDEGVNLWEPTNNCNLGEVISTSVGQLSQFAGDMNLSSSGDQIFIYQEINDKDHLIFGLNSEGSTGTWQDICNSTANSTLPSNLDNLTPSPEIAFVESDSGIYTGTRNFNTTTDALAAISNPGNWETSDSSLTMPTGSFSFTTTAVHLSDLSATTGSESLPWWVLLGFVIVPVLLMIFKRPKRDCCK
jgi:hypothetical protein